VERVFANTVAAALLLEDYPLRIDAVTGGFVQIVKL
jgi:hypothetical protein